MNQAIASATLILMRDSLNGIEVLIMRRSKNIKFLGGFWVFPGGAIDAVDDVGDELLTARYAAVRETQEEAGILVDAESLLAIDHWTTPEAAPKRFATWFFAAAANTQIVQHDGEEMMDSLWITANDAIAMHREQRIDMLPPTLVSLLAVAKYRDVAEALLGFKEKPVRHILPKVCMLQGSLTMLYPGDVAYAAGKVDDEALGPKHRCIHSEQGWLYRNDKEAEYG